MVSASVQAQEFFKVEASFERQTNASEKFESEKIPVCSGRLRLVHLSAIGLNPVIPQSIFALTGCSQPATGVELGPKLKTDSWLDSELEDLLSELHSSHAAVALSSALP